MIKIRILGTGSGIATKNRFNTSISVDVSGAGYLFDCGEPASALLIRNAIDSHKIKTVFISHMHIDHIGGLPQLIQYMQLTSRQERLRIFMPAEGINAFKNFLNAVYLFPEMLPFPLEILPIQKCCEDDRLKVYAFPNEHLQYLTETAKKYGYLKKAESYSFIMENLAENDKTKIAYTGDVETCGELKNILDKSINVLITELAHFKPDKLSALVSGYDTLRKIIVTHIHPHLDENIYEVIKNESWGNKEIIVARDGLEVTI